MFFFLLSLSLSIAIQNGRIENSCLALVTRGEIEHDLKLRPFLARVRRKTRDRLASSSRVTARSVD